MSLLLFKSVFALILFILQFKLYFFLFCMFCFLLVRSVGVFLKVCVFLPFLAMLFFAFLASAGLTATTGVAASPGRHCMTF